MTYAFLQIAYIKRSALHRGRDDLSPSVNWGRAIAKAGFPPRRYGFEPRSCHVGFLVDEVTLGPVFSKYFGFLCQFSFHRLIIYHPRIVQ
jgi:hypothetical protein